jgi:hypothetical protein
MFATYLAFRFQLDAEGNLDERETIGPVMLNLLNVSCVKPLDLGDGRPDIRVKMVDGQVFNLYSTMNEFQYRAEDALKAWGVRR